MAAIGTGIFAQELEKSRLWNKRLKTRTALGSERGKKVLGGRGGGGWSEKRERIEREGAWGGGEVDSAM